MSQFLKVSGRAFFLAIGMAASTCLAAGDFMSVAAADEKPLEQSWLREQQSTKPTPTDIVQQKAQIRAQQRMDRMASSAWYGISNSRPTGGQTPFMSRYAPMWEMPGGRPFAWYPYSRPGYVMSWR